MLPVEKADGRFKQNPDRVTKGSPLETSVRALAFGTFVHVHVVY